MDKIKSSVLLYVHASEVALYAKANGLKFHDSHTVAVLHPHHGQHAEGQEHLWQIMVRTARSKHVTNPICIDFCYGTIWHQLLTGTMARARWIKMRALSI